MEKYLSEYEDTVQRIRVPHAENSPIRCDQWFILLYLRQNILQKRPDEQPF